MQIPVGHIDIWAAGCAHVGPDIAQLRVETNFAAIEIGHNAAFASDNHMWAELPMNIPIVEHEKTDAYGPRVTWDLC